MTLEYEHLMVEQQQAAATAATAGGNGRATNFAQKKIQSCQSMVRSQSAHSPLPVRSQSAHLMGGPWADQSATEKKNRPYLWRAK